MKSLFLIPARGGSKGIPHKNIKRLDGKPLINYSIDLARQLTDDENICVSTDDPKIIEVVEETGLYVPFIRPAELASDTASSNDVICHAINYYQKHGIFFDNTVLLQPTSPLRTVNQIKEAMELYHDGLDMVVSVNISTASVVLFRENDQGYLESVFKNKGLRRQDAMKLYQYNGAIYIINNVSILTKGMSEFTRIKKYVMPEINSIDIDTMIDWKFCEYLLSEK